MSFLEKASLLLVFLTMKAGTFSFVNRGVRYNASIIVTEHTAPLGKFSFGEALAAVNQLASASFPFSITIRIGGQDYTLSVQPA